ncbi:MAG: helix-turn-helix domain-containing protein [Ferruginibacter sp.]
MNENSVLLVPAPDFLHQIEETIRKVLREQNPSQLEELLTSSQVKKFLNISSNTLQAWRDNNKIPFTRIGKKIFYNKSQIISSFKMKTGVKF